MSSFSLSQTGADSQTEARGLIFDIQRFSLHDGPGIRTTVFLKGCPLRCRWCHNPEGFSSAPQLRLDKAKCIGCGLCASACRQGVFASREPLFSRCVLCGECIRQCPSGALTQAGVWMTAQEVLRIVNRDRAFYADGGVTFSGGEALRQTAFLLEILPLLKKEGLHVAVDTCGALPWEEAILPVLPWVDLFLYDLKAYHSSVHKMCTGSGNETILENYQKLLTVHKAVWVRIPVINGYNTEEMEPLADFLQKHPGAQQIELIPYHTLGRGKYAQLGMKAPCDDQQTVPDEQMKALWELFHCRGLPIEPLR